MCDDTTGGGTRVCERCGNEKSEGDFRLTRRGRRLSAVCWVCRFVAARTARGRIAALPPGPFDPGGEEPKPRYTRTCPRCGCEQPAAEFYLHQATGRRASHCRACCRAARRRYYIENPDKVRAALRRSYQRQDPAKRRARNARYARQERARLKAAVRARTTRLRILGLLTLAERCEDCGRPAALVHHETYDDVLALASLCRSCHMKRHFRVWRKTGGGPVRYPWEYQDEGSVRR